MSSKQPIKSSSTASVQHSTNGSWTLMDQSSLSPSARFGHSLVACGDELLLFGGAKEEIPSGNFTYFNDIHRLCLRLDNEGELSFMWEYVPTTGDIPPACEGHCCCSIEAELYVFGGTSPEDAEGDNTGKCLPNMYKYQPSNHKWTQLNTSGPAPEHQNMSAVAVNNKIYVFGGVYRGIAQYRLSIYDIETHTWSVPNCKGFLPAARCSHSAAAVGHKMFIYGGSASSSMLLNDLCIFDTETLEWNTVDVSGVLPPSRDYCSLSYIGERYLLMFGGYTSKGGVRGHVFSKDLYLMDLASDIPPTWTLINTEDSSVTPEPRYSHSAVCVLNYLLVFGGMGDKKDFNDLWNFKLDLPVEDLLGFQPTIPPVVKYLTSPALLTGAALPLHRPPIRIDKPISTKELDDLQRVIYNKLDELFDGLREQARTLEEERENVKLEKATMKKDKKVLIEDIQNKQRDITSMIETHKKSNEESIRKNCFENDLIRKELAKEKKQLKREKSELQKQLEEYEKKKEQLDMLMMQFEKMKLNI